MIRHFCSSTLCGLKWCRTRKCHSKFFCCCKKPDDSHCSCFKDIILLRRHKILFSTAMMRTTMWMQYDEKKMAKPSSDAFVFGVQRSHSLSPSRYRNNNNNGTYGALEAHGFVMKLTSLMAAVMLERVEHWLIALLPFQHERRLFNGTQCAQPSKWYTSFWCRCCRY